MLDKKLNLSCHIFTVALLIVMILLPILRPGMHNDGIVYAGIARNLAHGIGSIWHPTLSPAIFPTFYEHPPLAFWIHSWFFRVLGDGYLVERIYICFFVAISIILVVYLWGKSFRSLPMKHLVWIPILLWIPTNLLLNSAFDSNYLEITAAIFSLLAVCFLTEKSFLFKKNRMISLFLASICLVLGFLCNGPVLLFPLAVPILQSLIYREIKLPKAILETFLLVFYFALFLAILFVCYPQALVNIKNYLLIQVVPSTVGARYDIKYLGIHRLHIVVDLLQALSVLIVLSVLSLFVRKKTDKKNKVDFWFFFALGACASLPIILAHRQFTHYLYPALPFYVVAFSQIITPALVAILNKLSPKKNVVKLFMAFAFVVLCASIIIFILRIKVPNHKKTLWEDAVTIGNYVGHNKTISPLDHKTDYSVLNIYFARMYQSAVMQKAKTKYYLAGKNYQPTSKDYVKIALDTKFFDLYKKTGSPEN